MVFPLFLVQHPYEVQQLFHHNIQTVSQLIYISHFPEGLCAIIQAHLLGEAVTSAWNNHMTVRKTTYFQIIYSNWLSDTPSQDWNHHLGISLNVCVCVSECFGEKTLTNMRGIWSESFKSYFSCLLPPPSVTSLKHPTPSIGLDGLTCPHLLFAKRPTSIGFQKTIACGVHRNFHAHDGSMGLVTGRFTYVDGWSFYGKCGPMDPLFLSFDFFT